MRGIRQNEAQRSFFRSLRASRFDICEIELSAGMDINMPHLLNNPLEWTFRTARLKEAEFLLKNGADILSMPASGKPLLITAIKSMRVDKFTRIYFDQTCCALIELAGRHGLSPHAVDKSANTLLHLSAARGLSDTTRLLASKGIDLNASNEYGQTPLHAAALQGKEYMCKLLIELGADLMAKNNAGETPAKSAKKGKKNIGLAGDLLGLEQSRRAGMAIDEVMALRQSASKGMRPE